MTNDEVIDFVYAHSGGERASQLLKPVIVAMIDLACRDVAEHIVDEDIDLMRKLQTTATNTFVASQFNAPSDMLFHGKKKTSLLIDGDRAYELADHKKISLLSQTVGNHFYSFDGRVIKVKQSDGATSGTYDLEYIKIPTVSDIDDDLRNLFLEFLLKRLGLVSQLKAQSINNGNTK
jgi:hypothetical protein